MDDRPPAPGTSTDADPAAALLRRWQESEDTEALDALLRLELGALKARLRHRGQDLVGGSASVSDIAQQTVVRLLEADVPPHFDNPRALRGWLWTVAWRLLIDRVRRPGRKALRLDDAESRAGGSALLTEGGLDAVEDRERSIALDLALNLLRPAEQEILRLVYLEQLGLEGAAGRLGITHEAATMRVVRARRSLAAKLVAWARIIG